jgi:hypothetical protein
VQRYQELGKAEMSIPRLPARLCWLIWITACGGSSEPAQATPCPEANGEFPPTHCAYVQGRLTGAGVPLTGVGLRVDDYRPPFGYAYVSDAAGTDAHGRFELVVFRLNQFRPPTIEPDTAHVFVKLYATPAAAKPGAPAQDSISVLMTFAPMGVAVDTTEAELILP